MMLCNFGQSFCFFVLRSLTKALADFSESFENFSRFECPRKNEKKFFLKKNKMEQEKLYDFSPPFSGSSFMLHPSSFLLAFVLYTCSSPPIYTVTKTHERILLSLPHTFYVQRRRKREVKTKEKLFHVVLVSVAVFGTFFFPPQFELLDFHSKVRRCLFIFTFAIARRCKKNLSNRKLPK